MCAALLPPDSFTSRRLEHATPEHLSLTARRTFIGPVPEGWLKSHRKEWFRRYKSSDGRRTPSFRAAAPADVDEREESDDRHRNSNLLSSTQSAATSAVATSTASLIRRSLSGAEELDREREQGLYHEDNLHRNHDGLMVRSTEDPERDLARQTTRRHLTPKVRFSEPTRLQLRARARRLANKGNFLSSKVEEGEVLKIDRMLVRIDITQQNIGPDFDEKISLGVETKTLDKWREFMVVCRKQTKDDSNSVLQLYKTRVITTSISKPDKAKKKPKASIPLSPARTYVNLYSSLDKSLCVWTFANSRTTIYYLRPQSGATSVEWYSFLRMALGFKRSDLLQVNIPDLRVSLRLDDPFQTSTASDVLVRAAEGDDDALVAAIDDEKGAAGAIVARCLAMLKQSPEWSDVLNAWTRSGKVGLAWKRYDRIEWVHGAVEQRMYGTIAMQRTHDLELRPKCHYPTETKFPKGKIVQEPSAVEGFLIRLTTQKGQERKMGKMLYKRLYFTTHNQYLVFVRPSKAVPPNPPKLQNLCNEDGMLSAHDIADRLPLVFEVQPYPAEDQHITWLDPSRPMSDSQRNLLDHAAEDEGRRNSKVLLVSDGYIDLCDVAHIRKMHKGAVPADEDLDDGSDVDFHFADDHANTDEQEVDGSTDEVDDHRVLELVMRNGLLVRLQAYSKAARMQWIRQLRTLRKYWMHRTRADMALLKSVREQNLNMLQIDERAEAAIGSFAYKWEVGQSYASPSLYNLCGINQCRTIHRSGPLFRKARKHTTFNRCHVMLVDGHLLVFRDTLRGRSGRQLPHTYHERIASISLQGCYLYSGLLTERDLLYQNRTFDSNMPGHHALPRFYPEDNWTSTDEDAMTTFVIWHAKSKSWFRSSQTVDDVRQQESTVERDERKGRKTKLTRVSQLGSTGRSVVFKARSRAERDQWVMAIQVEIERLTVDAQSGGSEDIRLVHE